MRLVLVPLSLMLATACNLPPKDPFLAGEWAVRNKDLLRALQAYDAVPVAHVRYPDARVAAGNVEQRMRRCHELILEALRLRSEWRDAEALEALRRASDHWPGQPSLQQWIAATEQRLQLFGERDPKVLDPATWTPAAPMVEVAMMGQSQPAFDGVRALDQKAAHGTIVEVPAQQQLQPLLPEVVGAPRGSARPATRPADLGATPGPLGAASRAHAPTKSTTPELTAPEDVVPIGSQHDVAPAGSQPDSQVALDDARLLESDPAVAKQPANSVQAPAQPGADADQTAIAVSPVPASRLPRKRLPTGEDPVALGLVAAEVRLGRRELGQAVRDLIELARRFPDDLRVKRRLSRLLHQRALMSYGQGAIAAAVADWRRVLEVEPDNAEVRELLERAVRESQSRQKQRDC